MNKTLNTILKRRSIRSFSNKLVTDNQIKDIITAGMYAPSAGNQQGWRFIVIKNRMLLDNLSKLSPYATPYLSIYFFKYLNAF